MGEFKAKSVADTKAFEEVPINERMDVFNTYDLLKKGAAIDPDAFRDKSVYDPTQDPLLQEKNLRYLLYARAHYNFTAYVVRSRIRPPTVRQPGSPGSTRVPAEEINLAALRLVPPALLPAGRKEFGYTSEDK